MASFLRESRWSYKHLAYGVIAVLVGSVLVAGWFNQSRDLVIEVEQSDRIFLVSDAGPIEVTNGEETTLTSGQSWLFRGPTVEVAADDDETVVRIQCQTRFPCRASVVLTVTEGTDVVVVGSGGTILVDSFAGDVTIYDDFGDTVLGDMSGSVKVVSATGRVFGAGLDVDQIDVSTVSSEIALDFVRLPHQLLVVTGEESTRLRLPDGRINLDVESPDDLASIEIGSDTQADSNITIRSEGPVVIAPTSDTP